MPLVGTKANASAFGLGWSASSAEVLGGMVLMTPTSIASTGTGNSSSIGANGSVTFSSCATLSLNGVFTSNYDNYMIMLRNSATAVISIGFRLRVSGTDNSGTNTYTYQNLSVDGITVSGSRVSDTQGYIQDSSTLQRSGCVVSVYGPNLSQPTAVRSVTASDALSSAFIIDRAFTHNQSTSYDGFTLITTSGTISGLVSVYGLGG